MKDVLKHAMQQLEWGCGWLESMYWQKQAARTDIDGVQMSDSIDLLSRVLAEKSFKAGAVRLVTELALLFKCDRVSLGLIEGQSVKICQLSNSAQFGKKMNLIRCIEDAMNESADQHMPIVVPLHEDGDTKIVLAHKELCDLQRSTSVMSVPLYVNQDLVGALTLERDEGDTFSIRTADYCEGVTALAISALQEKRMNDRHILVKVADSFKQQLSYLFGEEHYTYKIVSAGIPVTLLFLVFYQTSYRLSSDAILENDIRRSIVAPFDGYIDSALARAGDSISKGQLILSLDMKDLRLEKLKWLKSERKTESSLS